MGEYTVERCVLGPFLGFLRHSAFPGLNLRSLSQTTLRFTFPTHFAHKCLKSTVYSKDITLHLNIIPILSDFDAFYDFNKTFFYILNQKFKRASMLDQPRFRFPKIMEGKISGREKFRIPSLSVVLGNVPLDVFFILTFTMRTAILRLFFLSLKCFLIWPI